MVRSRFYEMRWGDTLTEVAHRHGTTVKGLCRINGIRDPDRIEAGRIIALDARDVCKVRIVLIDWDRDPIPAAKVRLEYCGRTKILTTKGNGCVPDVITESPEDPLDVSVMRPDGSWERIAHLKSGWGNKLVTLVSPRLKLMAETRAHPKDGFGKPVVDSDISGTAAVTPPARPIASEATGKSQTDFGSGKGVKTKDITSQGGALVKVSNDQAALDFLEEFDGQVLTDADFESAAKFLSVEKAVIRAVTEVESGGKGFVKINNRMVPTINYERHYFHRLTNGVFSAKNADISWKYGYMRKKGKYVPSTFETKDHDGKACLQHGWRLYRGEVKDHQLKRDVKSGNELVDAGYITVNNDMYLDCTISYKRLAKAYALNPEAALCSCSWGAFQIMGEHFSEMQYSSAFALASAMSRSEQEQLKTFLLFLKFVNPEAMLALKRKSFATFAKEYNGPGYKDNRYDEKLYLAYQKWKDR